jgi:probable F420-dependent oxidoreductase
MKLGTGFALVAMNDPAAVRDFAQTLDGAGFDFVTASGHLLSAPPGSIPDRPPMTYVGPFHEPFVLFSYLAGITQRLVFRNSIMILPLFQTPLIARQAAELSFFSGGRFELGVGISWNEREYEAMGQDIHNRGRRVEEQIEVLRLLWKQPFVTYEGRYHKLQDIGLNRLPDRPIPIWIGSGTDDRVLRRVARLADGWMPMGDPTEPMQRIRAFMAEEGRDPAGFGLGGRLAAGPEGPEAWTAAARNLQSVGVTHLSIGAPPDLAPADAMKRLLEARKALADAGLAG